MSRIDKTKVIVEEKAAGFLSGKPIWVWWISYTVLLAFLFGLFYIAWTLLTEKWWAIAIIIPVAGIAWSSVAYFNQKSKPVLPESEE